MIGNGSYFTRAKGAITKARFNKTWSPTQDKLTTILNRLANQFNSFNEEGNIRTTQWSIALRALQVLLEDTAG